jgi:hypothetical protein
VPRLRGVDDRTLAQATCRFREPGANRIRSDFRAVILRPATRSEEISSTGVSFRLRSDPIVYSYGNWNSAYLTDPAAIWAQSLGKHGGRIICWIDDGLSTPRSRAGASRATAEVYWRAAMAGADGSIRLQLLERFRGNFAKRLESCPDMHSVKIGCSVTEGALAGIHFCRT